MIRSARTITAGFILAAAALVGCGSDDSSSDATNAASGPTTTPAGDSPATTAASAGDTAASGGAAMTISGFTFSPLTVTAGETATVTNEDSANHTVTADDDSFSVDVNAGKTVDLVIDAAGTYAIHCKIHPQMSGTIVVN